jgi:hypothetical protein
VSRRVRYEKEEFRNGNLDLLKGKERMMRDGHDDSNDVALLFW